ncbi:MAG TPA: hypothetical protein EYQ85_02495, partial [Candidatus Poseidoniales archaeon]|nr:hypothetical protein [Candidatus Poseidoniales archaeon]
MASTDDVKSLWKWITSGGLIASMCCIPSVVMVAFGISSIATADALSKTLYFGIARPILYAISILVLAFGLWKYFRSQGICSLEEAKQQQRRVINTSILVLTIMILGYIIFNYFILELMGIS